MTSESDKEFAQNMANEIKEFGAKASLALNKIRELMKLEENDQEHSPHYQQLRKELDKLLSDMTNITAEEPKSKLQLEVERKMRERALNSPEAYELYD